MHERVTYSLCKHTHIQGSKSISVRTPSFTPKLNLDLIQFWAIKEIFQAPKDRISLFPSCKTQAGARKKEYIPTHTHTHSGFFCPCEALPMILTCTTQYISDKQPSADSLVWADVCLLFKSQFSDTVELAAEALEWWDFMIVRVSFGYLNAK